jgi:hypothetical protein
MFAVTLGAGVIAARASSASSPKGPLLEVSVIHATRADAGVDPRVGDLPRNQAPFKDYNAFKLLDRQRFPFEVSRPVTYTLTNGRTLVVNLYGVSEDAGERRYTMHAQIRDYLQGLKVTVSARQPFWLGGQSYDNGTLLIELKVLS